MDIFTVVLLIHLEDYLSGTDNAYQFPPNKYLGQRPKIYEIIECKGFK